MTDHTAAGRPISYIVLAEDTPVETRDGTRVGTVKRILADVEEDLFDGLILDTPDGDRFVDAAHAGDLHERLVVLALSAEEARHLPEPSPAPAEMSVDPDDTAPRSAAERVGDGIREAWRVLSGKY